MAKGTAADETAQAHLRNHQKDRERVLREAWGQVMALPAGRLVMYDLIFNMCGVMDTYGGQDSGIYRHEGRRAMGVEIVQQLQDRFPDHYILMVTERMQAQKTDKQIRDTTPTGDAE